MIAFRVDQNDLVPGASHLATNNKTGLEVLAFDGTFFLLLPAHVSHIVSGFLDAFHVKQIDLGI